MIVDVSTTVIITVVIRKLTDVVGGISCCLSAHPAPAKVVCTQQLPQKHLLSLHPCTGRHTDGACA